MQDMIDYSLFMMDALADFLMTPPIVYILGVILLCFIIKGLKILVNMKGG